LETCRTDPAKRRCTAAEPWWAPPPLRSPLSLRQAPATQTQHQRDAEADTGAETLPPARPLQRFRLSPFSAQGISVLLDEHTVSNPRLVSEKASEGEVGEG